MKEFISHIDYLIQKHDCVIIPEFGGFVLSHDGASFAPDGSVLPPKVTVGFNAELRYNDGLLAESYMSVYSISYDVACKRIEEAVRRLNTILGMRHPVQIGRLGKLALDKSNKLSFTPNANLSIFHPETFGLSAVNMKRLSDIEREQAKAKQRSLYKRVAAGVGASAAAVLLFFVASTPVSENDNTQKSSLFTDLISSARSEASEVLKQPAPISVVTEAPVQEVASAPIVVNESVAEVAPVETKKPVREIVNVAKVESEVSSSSNEMSSSELLNYFVVVSGATNQNQAQNLVNRFRGQGLSKSDFVTTGDRIRVYAESFATRSEAEKYLASIKSKSSQFHDAWIYFKK